MILVLPKNLYWPLRNSLLQSAHEDYKQNWEDANYSVSAATGFVKFTHCLIIFSLFYYFLGACYATLHSTLSVCPSVGRSVGRSVPFLVAAVQLYKLLCPSVRRSVSTSQKVGKRAF